ncbi:MAG: hypothetical protein KBT06_01505 [Prevotellaceae bacterium]|nr:hypothetical protein [Candidatus Colivivens equi]MCQ2076682.1 hypothetical protein [Bacteroidaceae bacterium]
MKNVEDYGLDIHGTMILEEYREQLPVFKKMEELILENLRTCMKKNGLQVTAIEGRIKTEESLAGKLELKGSKYGTLSDLTDIVGARIITFFTDDVDKISALMENIFDIDWKNSVDKRKMHELDSFGYLSLHYICRIPKTLYYDESIPEINEFRFELQMRTALQHVWANMYHDIGYKSGIDAPAEYLRTLNRLAGMLELADDEFSRIRNSITEYRYKVEALVKDGKFEEVNLDGDSFKKYLQLEPFKRLTNKIAAINQAEIHQTPMSPFLKVLVKLGCKTLGDVEKLKHDYSDEAYQLALHQIGGTDIDIIASNIGLQNLCIVYQLKNGVGVQGLATFFDILYGQSTYNVTRAQNLLEQAKQFSFLKQQ